MTQEVVHVQGLPETLRAFRRLEATASTELRKELRDTVGGKFATDARNLVVERGLLFTGALMGSIKPSVVGGEIVVRSSPPLKPGRRSRLGYAAVYEYGHGGRRSFLQPTLDKWVATGKLVRELTGYLNFIESEFRA